jgi:dTDP-4-dehydrorhamnose reductase
MLAKSDYAICATGKGHFRHNELIVNEMIEYADVDLSNQELIENLILSYQPTHILHLGAITQVDDCELNKEFCYSVNVDASKIIFELAKKISAKVVYLSTDFVFDGEAGPYQEDDLASPINYYGLTKMTAENLLKESGADHCVIRTVLLFGKVGTSKRTNFFHWVKENLENNKPIKVVDDQLRTPTYIPDLVEGIIQAIEKDAVGIYHISGNEQLTPYQMAIKVADHLKLDKSLITAVNASIFSQPAKRPLKTGFNISKAQNKLGYTPTPFDRALVEIFKD